MKECPQRIIAHKCWTNNNIQWSYRPWKLTFWGHSTLTAKRDHEREHGVASECGSIYWLRWKATLWWSLTCDNHNTCCCASQHSTSVLWLVMWSSLQGGHSFK